MRTLNNGIRIRLVVLFIFFMFYIFFLIYRVGYIKIVKGEEYEKKAIIQQVSYDKIIPPIRGQVLDRNKRALALDSVVYNVIFDPAVLSQYDEEIQMKTVNGLNNRLELPKDELLDYLKNNADRKYIILKKKISKEKMLEIEKLNLKGVWFEKDSLRNYVHDALASHVIGFVGGDRGRWGVEEQYDDALTGIPGREFITYEQDDYIIKNDIQPINGNSIILTIDETIQHFVEKALQNAVERYEPKSASAIAMDPNTGEILAMAALPDFNLNDPDNIENIVENNETGNSGSSSQIELLNKVWRNFNISDTYEPGSTFKPILVAAALEENIISPDDTFECKGYKVVYDRTIHCWKRTGHGIQTVEEALANSCNVAMMDIVEKMGRDVFYEYQRNFGFGEKTGIDLPGEQNAINLLHKKENLGPVELATSSFGQTFNVTPIQLINAFTAVINGGNLMTPYVMKQVVDSSGTVVKENNPIINRKVISQETSELLRKYLYTVVREGTGKKAKIAGYQIGGKTGTAEQGDRDDEKYVVSFVGFTPVENPKVVVLALMKEPNQYVEGSSSTAPIVKEILENTLMYMGIQPSFEEISPEVEQYTMGDYTNVKLMDAVLDLNIMEATYEVVGSGSIVVNQIPKQGTPITPGVKVYLYLKNGEKGEIVEIPDLTGKTYDEAIQIVNEHRLVPVFDGEEGSVEKQEPKPGLRVDVGSEVYIKLKK